MLLYEKYTPFTLNGFIGNREAIGQIRKFGEEAQKGKAKPIMIYGPSGVGKTAAARAVAYSNGFGLIELNASSYRDAETLRKKLMPATACRGLFNKISLVLFDEIDELSSKDKGAETIILQILKNSKQPIAFTATDFWDQRITFLRNSVEKVYFKAITIKEVYAYIQDIAKKETKTITDSTLKEIADRSNGDVRAALNDLEFVFDSNEDILQCLGTRNRKSEIFHVLDGILLTNSFEVAKKAFDSSDLDFGMLLNWIGENIPNRYAMCPELSNAYTELAEGSKFFEKAGRINYYSFLRYAAILASSGVSVSGAGQTKYMASYTFPAEIKYLSSTKKDRNMLREISTKLLKYMHSSRKDIINGFFPVLRILLEKRIKEEGKSSALVFFESTLGLEKDEAELILSTYK